MVLAPVDTRSGTTSGTTATITLPSWLAGDTIVLYVASNNGNAQTISGPVAGTQLASASDRGVLWRVAPNAGATTCTVTIGAASVLSWWVGTFRGAEPVLAASALNTGNDTGATISGVPCTASWVATGNETVLGFASTNSTATWATSAATLYASTSGNAALSVTSAPWVANALTATPAAADRGFPGSARNESAATLILQPTGNGAQANRLVNPSFEDPAPISSGWEPESFVTGTPAFTKVAQAFDGSRAQQMQYAGQPGDSGFFAFYQSPIPATPGERLTFRISLSGSKAACSIIVGIEGFGAGQAYISETDIAVLALTGTPTEYAVTYVVPPSAVAVAVYVQANEITPSTSITAQMDRASLVLAPQTGPRFGRVKVGAPSALIVGQVKAGAPSAVSVGRV